MIEMIVDSVRMGTVNTQRVVILKEKGNQRRLPIVLSAAEADPIVTGLKNRTEARTVEHDNATRGNIANLPLAHDLITKIIETYNGQVKMATINTIGKDRYYATLAIAAGGVETNLDCRAPDAIALAVRADAPIFIEQSAFETSTAAVKPRGRTEKERNLITTDDIKCPECGSKTTIRTSTKGPNAGKKFHVCNRYPDCKGKVSIQYKGH